MSEIITTSVNIETKIGPVAIIASEPKPSKDEPRS